MSSVFFFCFHATDLSRQSSFPPIHSLNPCPISRPFRWEVLFNAVRKSMQRVELARSALADKEGELEGEAEEQRVADLRQLTKHTSQLFVLVHKKFKEVLNEQEKQPEHRSIVQARWFQLGRLFERECAPLWTHIDEEVFAGDERLRPLFALFADF